MKRSQMYKKVNGRNNVFNHLNRNVVYPSFFLSSDEINNKGSVEIIELKSDEEPEKQKGDKSDYSHVWCYESDEQESNYRINREARERRRCQIDYDSDELYNELFDQMCTNFYGIDCHNSLDGTSNKDTKCFTIINNRLPYETSSDEEAGYGEVFLNGNETEDRSFEDNTYINACGEKRTVWIYSEKNKELLDCEYQNNPNRNSTSSSTDEDPIRDIKPGCIRRLATPIPTYIPKLFLPSSPTLPTVTEVVEYFNKSSSNTEINQSKTMTTQMPLNNWVKEKSVEREHDLHSEVDNNIFSWDALSPREKRRIKNSIKEENCKIDKTLQSPIAIGDKSKFENENIIEKDTEHQINKCLTNGYGLSSTSSTDKINNAQKPQIKMNHKIKPTSDTITEPLEKENGKWIGDETDEILDVYDYDLEQNDIAKETEVQIENDKAGNKFLVTNMSLLKPMEWTQYLPITGSIPSLHLSFETEIENRSWLKTLFRCFRCCKRDK